MNNRGESAEAEAEAEEEAEVEAAAVEERDQIATLYSNTYLGAVVNGLFQLLLPQTIHFHQHLDQDPLLEPIPHLCLH